MFEVECADPFKDLLWMPDEIQARTVDVIGLSLGDPDRPTPGRIAGRPAAAGRIKALKF